VKRRKSHATAKARAGTNGPEHAVLGGIRQEGGKGCSNFLLKRKETKGKINDKKKRGVRS